MKFLNISSSSSSVIPLVLIIEDDEEFEPIDQDSGDEEEALLFSFVIFTVFASSTSWFASDVGVDVGVVIESLWVDEQIELLKPLLSHSLLVIYEFVLIFFVFF